MAASSDAPPTVTRLGEVIETSTAGHWAESDVLHELPPLGALVTSTLPDGRQSYGIVAFGQTGGLDPGRRAIRRGGDELADDAIYHRHPELSYVLRTLFRVASVGFREGGQIRHTLPPVPVPLHYSVHRCERHEVEECVASPRYFASLLRYQGDISTEDLLAAHLRWTDEILDDGHEWLTDATRRVAALMKHDYDRLVIVLDSIDPGQ